MKKFTKLFTLIIMIFGVVYDAKTQTMKKTDLILLQDKSEINAVIMEITEDEIKYKKSTMPNGPMYSIKKSGVYMIIYSNGDREKIDSVAPATTVQKASTKQTPSVTNAARQKPVSVDAPHKEVAEMKKKPTPVIETLTTGGDAFDNEVGFLDIGTDINVVTKTGAPIYIVVNAYTNGFTKSVSKYLFLGSNINFAYQNSGTQNFSATNAALLTSLGVRYYLNGLIGLDPQKFQLYGGASFFTYGYAMSEVNGKSNSNSQSDFTFVGRVGGRYGFTKRLGIFSELAFANGGTAINAGLSFSIGKK